LESVPRKIALLIAALIVPGGFIAILCALALRGLRNNERGRKVIAMARRHVPTFSGLALGSWQEAA
jgi:hypothetical protein